MALELESIKTEMLGQLKKDGFAIFFSDSETDGLNVVYWDTRRHPDFREFLAAATCCGVKMMALYDRVLSQISIDDLLERVAETELSREEKLNYELRLRDLQKYEGFTCLLQLYFAHGSHVYQFEVRADWYEDFEDIFADVTVGESQDVDDDQDGDDPMPGYYSRN